MSRKEKELSGKQKAALLLISLGPEVSASVYKHLSEEEIERLTLEISSVKKVEASVKEDNFTPILVNDQCLIRAEFHDTIENIPYEIIIQPKMSFGTGHHSTTHLMVEYILETEFKGKDVLDMGCGTSILAILAMKKEANYSECIDIDEWAVENSIENGKRNGVSLDAKMGDNSLLGTKHFDVILANINKNILLAQIPSYINVLNQGGDLFLSGLMEQDFEDIFAFCTEHKLTFVSKKQRNEWIALHFKK